MATITSNNPATYKDIKTFDLQTDDEISKVLDECQETWNSFRKMSISDRATRMNKAAEILEENKDRYAQTMVEEMGKTLSAAKSEVEKCAWVCRYYAEHAAEFLADEFIDSDAQKSMICYRPLGVVLAVMPWNYPFWQVFRFAAPALMAGNVGVLKHASNVPQSALNIQEVFELAGFPKFAFATILAKSGQVKAILNNPIVQAATLTGSGPAGAAVASEAGKNIKHTVLELGGSDPYVVLEDADLEWAAEQCTESRLLNTGQSCIGAKRFIVVEEIYDDFLERFTANMKSKKMGDPMTDVDLGPMAREDLRNEVHEQVEESVKAGATLHLGGEIPDQEGAYYPATILIDVKKGMPAYDDEIFGPVASVIRVRDEKHAIEVANDTKFGLGACVFTTDIKRGERIAKDELEAGCCFVNHYVKSDPRLPFGGIKESGYGRELSHLGMREFVNIKTIYIK